MPQRILISIGLAGLLAWTQCAEGALSRDVSIYNTSGAVVIATAGMLAALALAGSKGVRVGTPAAGAAAGAVATVAGLAYVAGAPAFELLFAVHAAAACPLAVAWGCLLAKQPARSRALSVCVAGMLAAAFSFACIGNVHLMSSSALFPAASGLLLFAAAKWRGPAAGAGEAAGADAGRATSATAEGSTGGAGATGDIRLPSPAQAHQARLFAYALSALVLGASLFCGITASPVASNSSTPQSTMAAVNIAGLLALAAVLCACSSGRIGAKEGHREDALRGGSTAAPKTGSSAARQDIVLQLFVGLASLGFVAGLLLFSAAAAGTMTVSVGVICGVRQCLVCVCWIVFPQIAGLSEKATTDGRIAQLLLASGTLYAPAAGSLIDRACAFTFAQLLVIATACIALVALLAVAYLTLHMRNLLAGQAESRAAREQAAAESVPASQAHPAEVDAEALKQQLQALRLQQVEPYGLTERETQIALMLLDGQTMRGIAEELFITERTVKFHSRNAYEKMGVSSKKELMQKFSDLPPAPAESPLAH